MRKRILAAWGRIAARFPGWVIMGALALTIVSGIFASRLKMTTRWSDLLPLNDPMVQEFNKIIEEYQSASNTIMVVQGPEDRIKAFADYITPLIRAMDKDVKRVDYLIEKEFIEKHGFMLMKTNDLENSVDIFSDLSLPPLLTHINDNFEKVYTHTEESLSSREKENNAIAFLDGISHWLQTMDLYISSPELGSKQTPEAVDRFLMGDPYFISQDKQTLMISIEPTFSAMDMDRVVAHVDSLTGLIKKEITAFPDVRAGLTGMMPLARDEMVYAMKDSTITSIVAFVLIIVLFILSFRLWTAPLLAGINLGLGIIWAAGFSSFFLDSLNIMTSMFAVILFGLGIDFSIHIISLYLEMRYHGQSPELAVQSTLLKSGAGILTGASTTAAAFFTLMISDSRGIKEMGLILGVGILATMLSTILVLPAILVYREKLTGKLFKKTPRPKNVSFAFLGNFAGHTSSHPILYLCIGLLITGIFLWQALNITFDYDYLNMEPEGIDSVTLQDVMIEAFEMSPDFVLITAKNVEEARRITRDAKDLKSVSLVESISEFIPSEEEQNERRPFIEKIRENLTATTVLPRITESDLEPLAIELDRLDMNIYELAQMAYIGGQDRVDRKCKDIIGDPEDSTAVSQPLRLAEKLLSGNSQIAEKLNRFQENYEPLLRRKSLAMANPDLITLESLPEGIKNKFFNKRRDHLLITIIPKEKVWDFEFLSRFTEQMKRVDESITGMPPMFLSLINYIGKDGIKATLLTLAVVFLLLLLDFRSIRMALMAMIPLTLGAVWMVGLLKTIGNQLTFVNVIGLPMIVGIGIDDGVHIMHRWRIEGRGKIEEVFSSTGKAILLTSLTTMAGFGSLLLAKYRGFGSLGILLILGVASCFLTTVLIISSLMGLMERNKSI